jgi:hypothetical protein
VCLPLPTQLERKVLAGALSYTFNSSQREALYEEWGVRSSSKGRKLQLIKKLWDPSLTKDEGTLLCTQSRGMCVCYTV